MEEGNHEAVDVVVDLAGTEVRNHEAVDVVVGFAGAGEGEQRAVAAGRPGQAGPDPQQGEAHRRPHVRGGGRGQDPRAAPRGDDEAGDEQDCLHRTRSEQNMGFT